MGDSSSSIIVHLAATTHFPIKLTSINYSIWRKQVLSTLIGLDLDKFLTSDPPSQILGDDISKPNPAFLPWFRQDQIILGTILGSCSDVLQPIVSSADTSKQAWENLHTSYASTSRSRIISLKSRLANNPRGSRSVTEFLHDMKAIADDLALAQNPIDDEDLAVHILGQLGEEYKPITTALKVRETPLSYPELFDKLLDHERSLKDMTSVPTLTTVNNTQRQTNRNSRSYQENRYTNTRSINGGVRNFRSTGQSTTYTGGQRNSRNQLYCQFCNIPGHDTKECRKLSRLLRDNNITISLPQPSNPVVNTTSARPTSPTSTWMFDTGASHHVTTDRASLHTLSEYGGPDEIVLGNGSSHGGASNAGHEHK